MSATQFDDLLDLFATMKDEQIDLREQLDATREQVALLSEALIKPMYDVGQEHTNPQV